MPLYKTINIPDATIIIWKHNEVETIDYQQILTNNELEKLQKLPTKKKWEMIMIRKILSIYLPNDIILYKDNGMPYLQYSKKYISISHSYPYATLAISNFPIGVDIEHISDKILKIQDKFINDDEKKWLTKPIDKKYLTCIWAMKEALYKVHESKLWSLKKHYTIYSFDIENNKTKAIVFDNNFKDELNAEYFHWENIFICIAYK